MDLEQAHKHEPTILPAIDKNVSTFYLNLKYTVDQKIKWTLNPHLKCMHVIALNREHVSCFFYQMQWSQKHIHKAVLFIQ